MLAALTLLLATAAPHDPRCDSIKTDDLVACAQADYRRADAALNAAWMTARAKATAWGATTSAADRAANGNVGYPQALLASQRAWLAYRDAQCRLEVYGNAGGHELPIYRLGCLTGLTETRTRQLQDFAKGN